MALLNLLASFTTLLSLFLPALQGRLVEFQWQIVSSTNFSSQIRLHPHVLLFVTVPWCGESRSLMNEITQKMNKERDKFSSLKLFLVNRNLEKALTGSLGANDGITIFFYHHSVSYKYRGILRVPNILSSANYLLSLSTEDVPFKRLSYPKDLEMFLSSTDKAVILLESCGWTSRLLLEQTGNETLPSFAGGLSTDPTNEINQTRSSMRQKYLKDLGNDRNFDVDHAYGESPWVGDFSGDNLTGSLVNEDLHPNLGISCNSEEYNRFKSFFLKLMELSRDTYLPPQRQKYAFVSDRSLLLTLGIEDSDQWSLIISYSGCPGCLRKIKDEKFLVNALDIHDLPVMELPGDGKGLGPALPIDKPSIVLFVDRASESLETRIKSTKALHRFRELAITFWKSNSRDLQSSHWPRKSFHTYHKGSASIFKNHKLLLSPSSQINIKDKMSIMIINEGKQITLGNEASNLQGGAIHEILSYLAGQKKGSKLSSIAKEGGFQLLSDEVDVRISDVSSSREESISQKLAIKSNKVSEGNVDDKSKDLTDFQDPNEESNQKASVNPERVESESVDLSQTLNNHEIDPNLDVDLTTKADEKLDKSDVHHNFNGFNGSFFFSDGNYKFLRSLTNDLNFPKVVIIDPSSQQHYILLSENENFSVDSISTFIDGFLNGSLIPYQQSGPLRKSIGVPQPPFVNLDFREKDSIPCVTSSTFTELVLGSSYSNSQNGTNAWHKDVMVIFSSNWCGFCQRMELIIREVYRALKGYANVVESESKSDDFFAQDDGKDFTSKLPSIYLIDCTLNECSGILRSLGQREVYPSLVLLPAEKKTAIVYNGSMMVTEIIKFIAIHGTKSQHLAKLKGTLWTDLVEPESKPIEFKGVFIHGDDPRQNLEVHNPIIPQLNEHLNPSIGSFLVATELLQELNPFHKAKILLVRADRDLGIQGLIVNKPISSWDSLPQFEHSKLLEGAPLSFGGPVIEHESPLVSLTRVCFSDHQPQVLPGVYFLDTSVTLEKIMEIKAGNLSASDLWFFWGYSGWTWDQLLSEIAQGIWKVHEGSIQDLQWPE